MKNHDRALLNGEVYPCLIAHLGMSSDRIKSNFFTTRDWEKYPMFYAVGVDRLGNWIGVRFDSRTLKVYAAGRANGYHRDLLAECNNALRELRSQ